MSSTPDMARYHRQMLLRDIGEAGQRRLAASHVVIVGCGALGTVSAEILARAGVGCITIIDRDVVELTNLQRQVLFDERDAREGLPKAEAARRRLSEINSAINVRGVVRDFTAANAEALLSEEPTVGAIVDGTDNFETRYLINDLAVKRGVPWVYGAAVGMSGMSMTVVPGVTACLRCAFEEPPEPGSAAASATCDTVGVFAPVTAMIGSVQAGEAMKILSGHPESVAPGLLTVDGWSGAIRRVDLSAARRSDCACCGRRELPFLSGERGSASAALCGRGSVQISPPHGNGGRIDLTSLAERLRPHGEFEVTRFLVRGVLSGERGEGASAVTLTVFPDGRAIVGGVAQLDRARSIYARYVGS